MVNRIHGERAALHVAKRIGALTLAGDTAGVTRWEGSGPVSRSGEKLYGDWQRACDDDDARASARRREQARLLLLLLLVLAVGGSALFGFG